LKSASLAQGELAAAKINLALHVLGRRPDGYHDIDSIVVFADFGDQVGVNGDDDGFAVEGPFAASLAAELGSERNLAIVARERLATAVGQRAAPTALRLVKNIPVASGLGGGSADAAAVLRLLNAHWRLGFPPGELQSIGSTIGADVPMCVASVPLRATSRGDQVATAAGIPTLPLALVFPSAGVSTAKVFAAAGGGSDPRLPRLPGRFGSVADIAAWLGGTRNGLEEPAVAELPIIGEALAELRRSTDCMIARMTGSGSTCFGLFPDLDRAKRAIGRIRAERPTWWVRATATAGS
jgi:4-diphosphocytidyl-2-C-methyl-D-erythritol kinase